MKPRYVILFIALLLIVCSLPLKYLDSERKKYRIAELVEQCNKSLPIITPGAVFQENTYLSFVCDKSHIGSLPYSYKKNEIQTEIHYASSGDHWFNEWLEITFVAFIFTVIPFAWGFFLARLREVSRAVRGVDD